MFPILVVQNKNSSLFDLVYSDDYGPCCVTSMPDFRYFLVFVDDYSIMSWVYLWITQVSNVIKKFINEIKPNFPLLSVFCAL